MQFGLDCSKITARLAGVAAAAAVVAIAAVAVAGLGLSGPLVAPARAQGQPFSFADLAEGLQDTVVNISTAQRVTGTQGIPVPEVPEGSPFQEFFEEFFDRNRNGENRRSRRVQSLGSGFVVDASGIIITNNHVIAEADEITAIFADGTKLDAKVIGRDAKTDVAVLKVEADKPLKVAPFGDSEALRVGDWVMAIGNPFGFGGTVTVGIVSALGRDINSGPYDKFIQTDASINRGNSGGPLFNLQGEVIGINTAIISPSGGSIGIGFAVPSEIVLPVIEQLREFGETRRGWLGVRIQEVTDEIAESLGMEKAMGALVAGVTEGGPAAAAEIEPGDVIVEFDGSDVPMMRDLPRIVADTAVGKTVDVVVLRKGERVTVTVELGRLEEGERLIAQRRNGSGSGEAAEPSEALGLILEALSEESRKKYEIGDDLEGVLVTAVAPGSSAEEKRVVVGDVIVEVSQEAVTSPSEVVDRVEQLKSEGRRSALLLIAGKGNELRFVAVRIEKESDPEPDSETQQQ
jgi:serine protease Do